MLANFHTCIHYFNTLWFQKEILKSDVYYMINWILQEAIAYYSYIFVSVNCNYEIWRTCMVNNKNDMSNKNNMQWMKRDCIKNEQPIIRKCINIAHSNFSIQTIRKKSFNSITLQTCQLIPVSIEKLFSSTTNSSLQYHK
mgnify:CR=1 FL=1